MSYVGRFAPSPTGALHFGSLLAAVASFLDARKNKGIWLVRIEDLDPPRESPKASAQILRTLEQFHLHWDGEVLYQSQRHDAYAQAFSQLKQQQQVFACWCPRKVLKNGIHHSPCLDFEHKHIGNNAWRFSCPSLQLQIADGIQGAQCYNLRDEIGDFVLLRRDGLWAYQLAVVVDDEFQGVNQVVRGIDLLDSSARQHLLIDALGFSHPIYKHIPVATELDGHKLSKQTCAQAVQTPKPSLVLWQALAWLRQSPPNELKHSSIEEVLTWGVENWDLMPLNRIQSMPAPDEFLRPND